MAKKKPHYLKESALIGYINYKGGSIITPHLTTIIGFYSECEEKKEIIIQC
jgi:hypothetical protein